MNVMESLSASLGESRGRLRGRKLMKKSLESMHIRCGRIMSGMNVSGVGQRDLLNDGESIQFWVWLFESCS